MNVILTFYRNFIWPSSFVNFISGYILFGGSVKDAVYLLWIKVITSLGFGIYFEFFQSQQFYFFNNLGYSKSRLYTGVALVDCSLWFLITLSVLVT